MDYVQFRTSFRGFNKEDVVTFIDTFTKEKENQIAALQAENEQLRTMLVWSSKKPEPPKEEKTVAENVADGLVEAIADTPAPEGTEVPAEDALDAPIGLPTEPQANEELERLQAEIASANERNAGLEEELAALKTRYAELEQELATVSGRNEELLAEKQSYDDEVAALNDRNAELMAQKQSYDEEVAALTDRSNADLASAQQSCGDLQAELDALNERNSALVSEKELLEQRLEELSSRNDALLSEKASLADALEQIQSEQADSQTPDYGELELAAYRRAEETERLARERANRIYAEIEEALNNGSQQSEIDTNELLEIAQSVNDNVTKLQEKVGCFRENYRAIGDTLREVGNKP